MLYNEIVSNKDIYVALEHLGRDVHAVRPQGMRLGGPRRLNLLRPTSVCFRAAHATTFASASIL